MAYISNLDKENEIIVANFLQEKWRVIMHSLGQYSPIDFFAERDGKPHIFMEIKRRYQKSTDWDTVFLSLRKFVDLRRAAVCMGCKSYYVVAYDDGVFAAELNDDMTGVRCIVAGRKDRPGARNDIEPQFRFPVNRFQKIGVVEYAKGEG